jgi:hypothetical protein
MHRKDEEYVRNFAQENVRRRRIHRYDGNVNVDSVEHVVDCVYVPQYRVKSQARSEHDNVEGNRVVSTGSCQPSNLLTS